MEKKVYEAPMLEMISFETQELLANGGDNLGSFGTDWYNTDDNGNIQQP